MLLVITLFLPLVFALVTYLLGDRAAKYVSLAGGIAAFVGVAMMKLNLTTGSALALTYSHRDRKSVV